MRKGEFRSLERGLAILSLFEDENRKTASIEDIMAHLSVPRSTAYRFVRALKSGGFLENAARRGELRLGAQLAYLGMRAKLGNDLGEVCLPILEALVENSSETAFVSVRAGWNSLCVQMVESPEPVRLVFAVGKKVGLHAGAAGKVILAHMTPGELDRFLETELRPYTANTVTDPETLRKETKEISEQGYAISANETGLGAAGICVPIYSPPDHLAGVLNLAGPSARLDSEALLSYLDLLWEKAAQISARLK